MTSPTALITGASRGLGRELARHLATRGWGLVIDARHRADLANAAADLQALTPAAVVAIPGDVTDPDHAAALVAAAERTGTFSLLVNNASTLGPSPQPPLADFPSDDLHRVFAVNVVAPVHLAGLAIRALRANRGTIVNVTSDAATEPYAGWGGYGSSKAALEQASQILAAEEPDVRVLWVDPGDMNTQMHQEAFPGEDISDRPDPADRIPGLARILDEGLPSGRYRVSDFLVPAGSSA